MKSVYCLSLETFCLFGVSVYTLTLFERFWELVINLVTISAAWEYFGDRHEQNPQGKVIVSCFLAIYIFFSLVLAFALFHSIERKSSQILRGSTIVFCLIHVCELIIQVLYWCPVTTIIRASDELTSIENAKKFEEISTIVLRIQEISHVVKFIVRNMCIIAFIIILFMYARILSVNSTTAMLNSTGISTKSTRSRHYHQNGHQPAKVHNNNCSSHVNHNFNSSNTSGRNRSILP